MLSDHDYIRAANHVRLLVAKQSIGGVLVGNDYGIPVGKARELDRLLDEIIGGTIKAMDREPAF